MSQPNNERVGSFVSDLVAMAKATERLPGLEAELQRMQTQAIEDGQRIARLERKLLDAKIHEEELNAKLRSVEAERDNAGFRELEATDREDHLKRVIRDCQIAMGEAMKALEPITGQREEDPTGQSASIQIPVEEPDIVTASKDTGEATGQSGALPIASSQSTLENRSVDTTVRGEDTVDGSTSSAKPMEDGEVNPRPTTSPTDPTVGTQLDATHQTTVEITDVVSSTTPDEAQEVPPQPDPTRQGTTNGKPSGSGMENGLDNTSRSSEVPQSDPTIAPTVAETQDTASSHPAEQSKSASSNDDWWPLGFNRASNYSG